MRPLGWLLQLWRWIEPAERLDWILETFGLRERFHQIIAAGLGGIVMLILQRVRDAPIDWTILMVLGSGGLIFYFLNQLGQWSNIPSTSSALRALNPNAQTTIKFFTGKRVFTYIVTALLSIFSLSLHRGPSGIEFPWFREASPLPPLPTTLPSVREASPISRLSDLSNAVLRERASRFTAQLREFEAEHTLEERRIFDQETQEMRRQLPIITPGDRERENKIWQKNTAAMTERHAQYQATFNTRFRSRAFEFREDGLCTSIRFA